MNRNPLPILACLAALIWSSFGHATDVKNISAQYDFVAEQTDLETKTEHVIKLISPSGDKYDSFYWVKILEKSGLPILPETRPPGHGVIREKGGVRNMVVSFDCDYTKGPTEGSVRFAYEHPQNAYKIVSVTITAACKPLTAEQLQERHDFVVQGCQNASDYAVSDQDMKAFLDGYKDKLECKEVWAAAKYRLYKSMLAHATDLASLKDFASYFAEWDPEAAIPSVKQKIYRTMFNEARSSMDWQAFIQAYQGDDPDKLIPKARQNQQVALKKEEQERMTAERERTREQKKAQQESVRLNSSKEIQRCGELMTMAKEAIRRQREAAQYSGYVKTSVLYEAGMMISSCKETVAKDYKLYRENGGRESLESLCGKSCVSR